MSQRPLLLATAFVAGLFAANYVNAQSGLRLDDPAVAVAGETTGVAVVELFTSQGCSSCPPADEVLEKLSETTGSKPIHVLSFHVDYWNNLGWKDPYSLAASTDRQRSYARAWSSRRVYTPQMVVNGEYEFNGGNEAKADAAISYGLQQPATAAVQLSIPDPTDAQRSDRNEQTLRVKYRVTGRTNGCVLNLAVVTSPKATDVSRGENRGRSLSHVNVVRAFEVASLDRAAGVVELRLPADVSPSSASVIGYVQRQNDLVIIGATSVAVP